MIAKRVYVGEFAGSHSAGRPQKRWLDTVMPKLYETLEWINSVCDRAYNLKGIKGKILKLCFSFTVAHFMACVPTPW